MKIERPQCPFLRAVVVILRFACVAFPAKAEIVHLNTLGLNQTRSTDVATQYKRQFNVLSDSRITSILLQPSETQTSSLFAFPSVRVSINGSEFRYVSRDETTRVLTLTGDNGWTYSAKGHLRHYQTGNIASVSLQAAYRF